DTPMVEKSKLDEDKDGKAVDLSHYRVFAYADHAGFQDTRCSTSGSLQFLGERLIRWSSKRQKSAAISSTKAEYIAKKGGKPAIKLLHNKLHDLSFLYVFGALCYPTKDNENLGKLQPKADIGIFIGYAPTKKAFRIYNRRTRRIIETIHVDFDEPTVMALNRAV
nr:integrase, catalytic region, zinc finger, CCHC-type, peptidase aspartic, catalytic [Tanacetum cinerariifolium]